MSTMGAHLADWMMTELKARAGTHTKSYTCVGNHTYALIWNDIASDKEGATQEARDILQESYYRYSGYEAKGDIMESAMGLMAMAGKAEAMLSFAERLFYTEHLSESDPDHAERMLDAARDWRPKGELTRVEIEAAETSATPSAETPGSKPWQRQTPKDQTLAHTMPPPPPQYVDLSTNVMNLEKRDYAKQRLPAADAEDKIKEKLVQESMTLNPLSRVPDMSTLNALAQGRRDIGHTIAPGAPLEAVPKNMMKYQKMLFQPRASSSRPLSSTSARRSMNMDAQLKTIQESAPLDCMRVEVDFNELARVKVRALWKRQQASGRKCQGTPPLSQTFVVTSSSTSSELPTVSKKMPARQAAPEAPIQKIEIDDGSDDEDWGADWKNPDSDPTRKGTAFDKNVFNIIEEHESVNKIPINLRKFANAGQEIRSRRGSQA